MKYGSVCSGIEAATVAWHPLGWQPAWFSEIEPFPSAVLAHHYPTVPNYGDMTKFEEWPDEPIDLLVGGTPCQSFSVAGLRKGLADPRGNLMLTFGAIAKRCRPEWLVWENVPGVLSSNAGRDFGTFLGMLAELGYGFAYRVLDAQYFGVAQRRRRVFVVANARGWQRAAAVLFERQSLQGHPAPSREKGQDVAGTIAARFGISRNNHEECVAQTLLARRGRFDLESETPVIAPTLQASDGAKWGCNQWVDEGKAIVQPVAFDWQSSGDMRGRWWDGADVAATLTKQNANGAQRMPDKDNFGAVLQPIGFGAQMSEPQTDIDLMQTLQAKNPMAVAQPITQFGDIAGSLTARHDSSPCADRGQNVVAQPVAFTRCDNGQDAQIDVTPTMRCGSNYSAHLAVAQPLGSAETAGTLRANAGSGFRSNGTPVEGVAIQAMQVRRLTPIECERLQGFLDGYTDIPWRGKPNAPDGPRYKALGNSMAVPVMHWIGQRIQKMEKV